MTALIAEIRQAGRFGNVSKLFLMGMIAGLAAAPGQSISLSLASASTPSGGTVTLPLTATASTVPAAVFGWRLQYPAASIRSINVVASGTAVAAGKGVQCSSATGGVNCILTGLNSSNIANGVIANVQIALATSAAGTSVPVSVTDVVSATLAGRKIPTTATGSSISVTAAPTTPEEPAPSGPALTSLSCSPATIIAPATGSTCQVTLSGAAPAGGATVALTSSSAAVKVPASGLVPAGMTNVAFAISGSSTTAVTAQVSSAYNGSARTVPVSVVPSAAPALSGVMCNPGTLSTPGTATCTVTLSAAAPVGGAVVTLSSSSSALLSVPTQVVVPAGSTSQVVSAAANRVTSNTSVTLTAAYGGATKMASIVLTGTSGPVTLSAVTCNSATLAAPGGTNCTATLSGPAPAEGIAISLSVSGPASTYVKTPSSVVTVSGGASSAQFAVAVSSVPATTEVNVTGAYNGVTKTVTLRVQSGSLAITAITCSPNPLNAGALLVCKVDLSRAATASVVVYNSSSSTAVRVPTIVMIPPGSSSRSFSMYSKADAASQTATITSRMDTGATVSAKVAILGKVVAVAARQELTVQPRIEAVVNAVTGDSPACSPGGVAAVFGSNFGQSSGDKPVLEINGNPVPSLLDSDTQILFECPAELPAGELLVAVRNQSGVSELAQANSADVAPGIFTVNAKKQGFGAITLADTAEMTVGPEQNGNSAIAGEIITIYCTGLGRSFGGQTVMPVVLIDGISAEVMSAHLQGEGVYTVKARVPEAAASGHAVDVVLEVPGVSGTARSNVARMFVASTSTTPDKQEGSN